MKILLSSHFFHPGVGGIEGVSRLLATEFVRAGHEVKIITTTREDDGSAFPFGIVRRPGPARLLALVRWCDVFFHNNISLRAAWPLLLVRRPWVVAHHTWIGRVTTNRQSMRDGLKHRLLRYARNISISEPVARHVVRAPSVVIGNPYRDALFVRDPQAVRDRDLVFLGRLVVDKGVDLLLDAMALLKRKNLAPTLTIVGSGPELENLRRQTNVLGLTAQVNFAGTQTDGELVALLNRHKLVVVPSRWQEPFGLAALEGVACGCVGVVADCGGLPDAIGPCGVKFVHRSVESLTAGLRELLSPGADLSRFRQGAEAHLRAHRAEEVARRYLEVLEAAVR